VSVADPSVWYQLTSAGTFRKRKYRSADDPRPLLQPVERVEDPLLRRLLRRHQRGGWIG